MTNEKEIDLNEDITIDELLKIVHSVNLYDRTKSLRDCIQDELEFALKKVNEYRKNAEINITIKIQQGDRCQLNIIGNVTSKTPKGSIKQNIFYQDSKDGKLYVDDPNQLKLINVTKLRNNVEETHAKGAVID